LIKKNYLEIRKEDVSLAGSKGVSVRWLIKKEDGAIRYAMRRFDIKSGGLIGLHSHPEEHEIYILSGKGEVFGSDDSKTIVDQGDVLYVPPYEKHGYKNLAKENFVFLCVIPLLEKK
jgi:quercetin dioxygenase-like cupin family protein